MLSHESPLCAVDLRGADAVIASDAIATAPRIVCDRRGRIIEPQMTAGSTPDMVLDASDCVVLPGLVDQHIHGLEGARCYGHPHYEDALDHLTRIAASLPRYGVTSFVPTTMAEDFAILENVCHATDTLRRWRPPGSARSLGVHLEGPFLAVAACGAHDETALIHANRKTLEDLTCATGSAAILMTFAPEAVDDPVMLREWSLTNDVRLSVGHTTRPASDWPRLTAMGGFRVTHLFNAFGGLDHRRPSVAVGALLRSDITCELVCDGHLVHEDWVEVAVRMLGPRRIVAVSDAIDLAGEPPQMGGSFAGTGVHWDGDGYVTDDGGLVWSSGKLLNATVRRLRSIHRLSWDDISSMTSRSVSDGGRSGRSRLATGEYFDCVVLRSSDCSVVATLVGGEIAFCSEADRLAAL